MASAFTGSFAAVFAPASVPCSVSVKEMRERKLGGIVPTRETGMELII